MKQMTCLIKSLPFLSNMCSCPRRVYHAAYATFQPKLRKKKAMAHMQDTLFLGMSISETLSSNCAVSLGAPNRTPNCTLENELS